MEPAISDKDNVTAFSLDAIFENEEQTNAAEYENKVDVTESLQDVLEFIDIIQPSPGLEVDEEAEKSDVMEESDANYPDMNVADKTITAITDINIDDDDDNNQSDSHKHNKKENSEGATESPIIVKMKDYATRIFNEDVLKSISLANWELNPRTLYIALKCNYEIRVSPSGNRIYDPTKGVFRLYDKSALRPFIKKHINVFKRDKKLVEATAYELESEAPDTEDNDWDSDEGGANVQNGYYLIDKQAIVPHNPAFLSTIQLPFKYIPSCTLLDAPYFNKCLIHSFGDDNETREFVLDFMAIAISNVRGSRIKGIVILCGPGNTGKTLFRQLLIALLGRERSANISISRLNQKFGSSALFGTRIAGEGDVSVATKADFSNLKNLTGGDDSMMEFKFKNISMINYRGVFLFVANELPVIIGDKGDAVFDRLYIVPYENVVKAEERNTDYLNLLLAEKDVIGSFLLDRLKKITARGYILIPSQKMLEKRKKYQNASNSLIGFINECCIVKNNGLTRTSYFNRIYEYWCKSKKISVELLGTRKDILKNTYGVTAHKSNGHDYFNLTVRFEKITELCDMFSTLKEIVNEMSGNKKGKRG